MKKQIQITLAILLSSSGAAVFPAQRAGNAAKYLLRRACTRAASSTTHSVHLPVGLRAAASSAIKPVTPSWRTKLKTAFGVTAALMGTVALRRQQEPAPVQKQSASAAEIKLLFEAVDREDAATIRKLIESGVNPNTKNIRGITLIGYAILWHKLDIVELLLALGADTKGALHYAVNAEWNVRIPVSNLAIVKLLVEHGANVNDRDENGRTPLFWMSRYPQAATVDYPQKIEILEFLIKSGADVNAQDVRGVTPLYHVLWFFSHKPMPLLQILIAAGANVNIQDIDGTTPLHIAISKGQREAVELLLKHGANTKIRNKSGASALNYAVMYGDNDILKLFSEQGISLADPELVYVALGFDKPWTVQFLLQYGSNIDYSALLAQAHEKMQEAQHDLNTLNPDTDEFSIHTTTVMIQRWKELISALEPYAQRPAPDIHGVD